jgi:hypothetical protein
LIRIIEAVQRGPRRAGVSLAKTLRNDDTVPPEDHPTAEIFLPMKKRDY